MPEPSLKNSIITWLKEYPYWMQYAGSVLFEGSTVTKDLTDYTYQLFLEDSQLVAPSIERIEIEFVEESEQVNLFGSLKINEVKEISGVNALATGQVINISDQLTIIYGGNGSGKSGYIRMLNTAFKGRGDKEILPNVFEPSSTGQPSCIFTFQSDGEPFDLKFPEERTNEAFTRFSVFDTQCVKVHLENENSLMITLGGFELFNKIINLFEGLEQRLFSDIAAYKGTNDFIPLFQNNNEIQQVVIGLGADTDIEKLNELANYTETDFVRYEELVVNRSRLSALNIPQHILEQQALQNQLIVFKQDLENHLLAFSEEKIKSVYDEISSYNYYHTLSIQQGIASLRNFPIPEIGTKQWSHFIFAGKEYADHIDRSRGEGNSYPVENSQCLFCPQPLTTKENSLITTYWNFLQSEAETKVNSISPQLGSIATAIHSLKPLVFDETISLFNYINNINPALALTWKEIIVSIEQNKKNSLTNITAQNEEQPVIIISNALTEFDPVTEEIQNAIAELSIKNPTAEIALIDIEIKYLLDKSLLNKMLDKIMVFIDGQKWARIAGRKTGAFRTNAVTTKQGELFALHITEKYTQTFNAECIKLNAPGVVNITQRNVKGKTLRKLQVANHEANKILSEGEQKAICLADFLTEMQLNPGNKGIIFDDPVTSLDHERRERIAKRLAEEALKRQVIVFTHDIGLLLHLQFIAEDTTDLVASVTSIRKQGGKIGVVHPTLPWIAQKVKDRIGYLRNALVRLKKIESEGTEDEYIAAAKSWYGLLREAWERAVEERLFKGVVERYAPGVQTNRLKKLFITDQMLKDIDTGMTESSKWVHDSAAVLNPQIPDTSKAEADLTFFDAFARICVAA